MKSNLDLNLLKVLPLLYQHKRLKEVARILGKSEASVSKYLSRLREQFDNELFTLTAQNGYEPTPFMVSILPELENTLSSLDTLIDTTGFKPEKVEDEITIALPQHVQFFVGHRILRHLKETFLNASFRIVSWDDDSPKQILDGNIDIGIQLFSSELSKALYQKVIGKVGFSIVVPDRLAHLSLEETYQLPFIIPVIKGWQYREAAQLALIEKSGIRLDTIAHIDGIGNILKSIDDMDGATVIVTPTEEIEGFTVKKLSLPMDTAPPVVAVVKTSNRNNPFHQHLIRQFTETNLFNVCSPR